MDVAVDDEIEAGRRAELILHGTDHRIAIGQPGDGKQPDHHNADERRNRRPEALYSLGYRQSEIRVGLLVGRTRGPAIIFGNLMVFLDAFKAAEGWSGRRGHPPPAPRGASPAPRS